jgi:xylan 1,4-beta-xylosidase
MNRSGFILQLSAIIALSFCLSHKTLGQAGENRTATYINPVVRGFNPDPSICRVGEDYYMITSSSSFYPGVPVYKSRDLINWKLIGHCLTRPEHFLPDKNNNHPVIYAGTLRYHNGTFYMVTTDVNGGGNFYVTATDPAGPWSNPVCIDKPVFDPSLFFDDNGKVYYTRRGEFANKDIVQAEIDIKTGKLLTSLKSISKGLVGDDTEGPHLFKANGWYYLTMGEGGSRYLHMQSIARSKSPWGPFQPCPRNPVISQHNGWWHHTAALGHADFIEDHSGNWWAVCLGQRKAGYMDFCVIGRETFLFPVKWEKGWPYVNPDYLVKLPVDCPTLPLFPWPEQPARDDFNEKELALHWNLMAYPLSNVYSLTDRPGYLRLYGTAEPVTESAQVSFVGRRQEEMAGEITANMEFIPTDPHEEAGLSVYQSPRCKYEFFITMRGGQRYAILRKTTGDMVTESSPVWVTSARVWLKISFDTKSYRFSIAEREGNWKEAGSGLTNLVSTDVAGTFGGVVIGPYATGNGKPCKNPADFDWVEYKFKEIELSGF